MSLLPRKISWTEPWDWEVRKERIRQCHKALPPLWRIGVYSLIVFGVLVAARIIYPEARELLTWGQIVFAAVTSFIVFPVLLPVIYVAPYVCHVTEKGVFFQLGNSGSRIDVKDITSLSFETRDGRRFFVVKTRSKKGMQYECLALMAKKKITEEDVKRFLYDVNLSHLYVASGNDQKDKQECQGPPPISFPGVPPVPSNQGPPLIWLK